MMKSIKLITLFIFLFVAVPTEAGSKFVASYEKSHFRESRYLVTSNDMGGSDVPVFVYHSDKFDKAKPLSFVLFLHGRGYARQIEGESGMLEHADLSALYEKDEFKNVIFIAPQDIFFHQDSNSVGQDYWIGKDGRDWPSFLASEMTELSENHSQKLNGLNGGLHSVIGISMGAHGALLVSQRFPEIFKKVISLSPVFRPVKEEMPASDYDVFLPDNSSELLKRNVGSQILKGKFDLKERLERGDFLFIEISKSDFALDKKKFPLAWKCWETLLKEKKSKHLSISISEDDRGHSMKYWKDILPTYLKKIL